MEILSKSINEQNINNNIFTDDNYKYIFNLKMTKIKEEIKDYIIDKYIMKIIEQNKEITKLKKELEDLTKSYINIIKILIENKNINLFDSDNINNYILDLTDKNEFLLNNKQFKNGIKSFIKKSNYEFKKNSTKNNFNKMNNKCINSYDRKKNKTYNFNNINMSYLKELNKKDLQKLNLIKNKINKTKASKNYLKKEFHIDFNKTSNSKNDFKRRINSNKDNFKENVNNNINNNTYYLNTYKYRINNKEDYIINNLTLNTEQNKPYQKKFTKNMTSAVKNHLFSQNNSNINNFNFANSVEDFNREYFKKHNSTSKKHYNKCKLKGINNYFYIGKDSKFNDSSNQNSIENHNILSYNTVIPNYICNPVFDTFLDRIENN